MEYNCFYIDYSTLIYLYCIGPGPMEAMANGCVFIQPRFKTPHNRFNTVNLLYVICFVMCVC